jgi:hypothetical protein
MSGAPRHERAERTRLARATRAERARRELEAYHDGELSLLGRLRVRRRLARDPAAARELEGLRALGAALRDGERRAEAGVPDLWPALRAELGAAGQAHASAAPRAGGARAAARPAWPWVRVAVTAAAGAAAALALTLALAGGDAPAARSLRWLDAGGSPAMVLQDDPEATIIWLLEAPERSSRGTTRVFL